MERLKDADELVKVLEFLSLIAHEIVFNNLTITTNFKEGSYTISYNKDAKNYCFSFSLQDIVSEEELPTHYKLDVSSFYEDIGHGLEEY